MIRVMIVEDDPMVRQINRKFLKKVDGFCLSTETGSIDEAKAVITSKKTDLILLDIYLPNNSGLEFLNG